MKYFVTAIAFLATTTAFAQTTPKKDSTSASAIVNKPVAPAPAKKDWSKVVLRRRANDHFMFQLGYTGWAGVPDSVHINGFNRTVNFYFMFDFPFKNDPRLSLGTGLGLGINNVYFDKQEVMVAAYANTTLAFPDESGTNHWKKYKLVTTFLQIPVELRFALDPEHTNSSWKFAVGGKLGLLMSSYTKGKTWQNSVNQTLGNITEKESSKQFFNSTQLVGTARVSKGVFGVFGEFQANSLLKSSAGPSIFPFTFGIMLSGL